MKARFLTLLLCVTQLIFADPIKERAVNTDHLNELFAFFDIKPTSPLEEVQKKWARKPGLERWEIKEDYSEEQKQFVFNWVKQSKTFDLWYPNLSFYDKAFIFGATTKSMRERLNYLVRLWNDGIRFDEIIFLTGDRNLDPRIDEFTDLCSTEAAAAKHLWEITDLPTDFRSIKTTFIVSPSKTLYGTKRRPNTGDTIQKWLETNPSHCSCLFISSQPYAIYQYAVLDKILPDFILFDVASSNLDESYFDRTGTILDTLAKWVYLQSIE